MTQRIDEECGATAHLFAQQRDASAGVIESFNDDVFQFVAKELLDGAFVLLLDLGVIGEYANGAKTARLAAACSGEQLLHRFGGVGAVIQYLFQRAATRTSGRELFAKSLIAVRGFLLRAPQGSKRLLHLANLLGQAEGA